MKITCLSLPYVYPLCPLNFNHAKMFVVADVFARYTRLKNRECDHKVIFPVASHFTGNTAHAAAHNIKEYFIGERTQENTNTYKLYKNIYGVPHNVIKEFSDPQYLMNYFHSEIIWELKSMGVSCDYKYSYTTENEDFPYFVRAVIKEYEKTGLLISNKKLELALNYDDPKWRDATTRLIQNTEIKKEFQKNNILSAFKNLSGEWELLRNTGFGVCYDKSGLIIDPMFDSELLTVFDLFQYWKQYLGVYLEDAEHFFSILMRSLKENHNFATELTEKEEKLVERILASLPCDIFFGEEHLKNWICKKFFAEVQLLHPSIRTKTYRVLGMGMLDGKRMSASRGHAVLSCDLIKKYGGQIARLTILLSGGNISKPYNYEVDLPYMAKRIFEEFNNYWIFLNSDYKKGINECNVEEYENDIHRMLKAGYIRKAVTYLLVNIPTQNKRPSRSSKENLIAFYEKYLNIFLPEFTLCQMQ